MSLDTLPIEVSPLSLDFSLTRVKIFHNVAVYLPPKAIRALALAGKETHSRIYAGGSHLWRQLFLCKYDSVRTASEGVDWMLSFQSRNWVEKKLRLGFHEPIIEHPDAPVWKISGQTFLETLRDMILENETRNEGYLESSDFVNALRFEKDPTQFSAILALFLSPIAKFNPHLSRSVFSAAQRAVYVPGTSPLFLDQKVPNFTLILAILKFFQHHLNHMRRHIRPVTTACHQWHNAGVAGTFAFQPGPHVTKSNFDNDPRKIEGEWSGLYSYLGWADFEALRDGNPAVLRANRSGELRDYLGGPQHLTIRLKRPGEKLPLRGNNVINIPGEDDVIDITGEGRNGGSFTFNGKLRKVHLRKDVFGQDMHLYWRLTFVKTYANGENSWTRWIYDGIYCPGVGILGRWRDGTEPACTGVTGPFWLWPKGTNPPSPEMQAQMNWVEEELGEDSEMEWEDDDDDEDDDDEEDEDYVDNEPEEEGEGEGEEDAEDDDAEWVDIDTVTDSTVD